MENPRWVRRFSLRTPYDPPKERERKPQNTKETGDPSNGIHASEELLANDHRRRRGESDDYRRSESGKQLSLRPPATDHRRCRIGHESIDAIWSYQPTTTAGGEEARAGNSYR
eukprot:COSAG02_NODE_3559_length_6563_cov_4.152382_2_plen_113_part_00